MLNVRRLHTSSSIRHLAEARNGFALRHGAGDFRVNHDFASRYYGAHGGSLNGCPPGLWAKNNGCMPPGQAQKLLGASVGCRERFCRAELAVPGDVVPLSGYSRIIITGTATDICTRSTAATM